eukprot:COSAG04_NODE_1645_length_6065_cov_12.892558_4_plen_171_part_00
MSCQDAKDDPNIAAMKETKAAEKAAKQEEKAAQKSVRAPPPPPSRASLAPLIWQSTLSKTHSCPSQSCGARVLLKHLTQQLTQNDWQLQAKKKKEGPSTSMLDSSMGDIEMPPEEEEEDNPLGADMPEPEPYAHPCRLLLGIDPWHSCAIGCGQGAGGGRGGGREAGGGR